MFKFFGTKDSTRKPVENWHQDRIGIVTLQRNFLLFMIIAAFFALFASLFTLFTVTKARNIEPFIIEIEKKSGVVTVVNPLTMVEYSANRTVNNYFLIEYLKARELFNSTTYQYYYYTYVRLFSSVDVYNNFKSSLSLANQFSPINLYRDVVNSKLTVRTIQYLAPQSVQLRFTLEFTDKDGKLAKKNKIATIGFQYSSLQISEEDRYINPLSFMVNSYQVDDDYA